MQAVRPSIASFRDATQPTGRKFPIPETCSGSITQKNFLNKTKKLSYDANYFR